MGVKTQKSVMPVMPVFINFSVESPSAYYIVMQKPMESDGTWPEPGMVSVMPAGITGFTYWHYWVHVHMSTDLWKRLEVR